MDTTRSLEHTGACCRIDCEDPGRDIVHREVPEQWVVPESDPERTSSFSLIRCDELDEDGKQIIGAPEALVTYGSLKVIYSMAESHQMARAWIRLLHRLHQEQPTPEVTSRSRSA